MVKKSCR